MTYLVRREDEDSGGKLIIAGRKDHWRCGGMSQALSKSWQKSARREELQRRQCRNTWAHGLGHVLELPRI